MARLWTNSIRGELSSGVTAGDTTLEADIFAELPTVSGGDTLRLTLDPGRDEGLGKPEVVEVTAHSASSTSVTVTRAVETGNNGGSAQAWPSGTTVVHGFTADEADDLTSHRGSSSNPHSTTAAQVGAAPTPHDLASGHHNADTLANLNSKVSDATLISQASANATYVAQVGGTIRGYTEPGSSPGTSGTVDLDLSQHNFFDINPSGDISFTFSGLPSAGNAKPFTIRVANDSHALTWPAGTLHPGGEAPALDGETWLSGVANGSTVTVGAAWAGVA